jgi:hypothetical protein
MDLATARIQFRIVRRPTGWAWVLLRADAGQVLAAGARVHPTAAACRHTIEFAQLAAADRFHTIHGPDGRWRWELVDSMGQPVARSSSVHADVADCRGDLARFRSLAPRASLIHAPPPVEGPRDCRPSGADSHAHHGRARQAVPAHANPGHANPRHPGPGQVAALPAGETGDPRPPSLKRHRRHSGDATVTLESWSPAECHICVGEQRTYGRWVGEQRRLGHSLLVPVDQSRATLERLCQRGLSIPSIARMADLNPETLRRILAGKTSVTRARTEKRLVALADGHHPCG